MTGTDVATRAGLLPARVQQPGLGAQRPAATDLRSLVLAPGSAKRTLELLDSRCAGATLDASSAEDYNQRNPRSTGTQPHCPSVPWAGLTVHPREAGIPGLAGMLGDILRGACLSDRLRCAMALAECGRLAVQVILVMRTPGVDEYRQRRVDDRTYDVVTLRDGLIVGLYACRDRSEARSLAGIG